VRNLKVRIRFELGRHQVNVLRIALPQRRSTESLGFVPGDNDTSNIDFVDAAPLQLDEKLPQFM